MPALFAGSIAAANPVPYNPGPAHIQMYLEKIDIKMVGDVAKVKRAIVVEVSKKAKKPELP